MHEAKELRTGFVETNGTKLYYDRIVYDFLKSLE